MPLIPYPNVPPYPGVPPLAGTVSLPPVPLLRSDAPGLSSLVTAPRWGIYLDGQLVLEPDSFVGMDYSKEYSVANFPVERGSFASYNKVAMPYDQRISLACGGTDAKRAEFVSQLEFVLASTELYVVLTPGAVYVNANLTRVSYSRHSQHGVSLLVADVSVQEIRVAGDLLFKNTISPSGAALQDGGPVQTREPTAAQQAAVSGGIQ